MNFRDRMFKTMESAKAMLQMAKMVPGRLVGAGSGSPTIVSLDKIPKDSWAVTAQLLSLGHPAVISVCEMWYAEVPLDYKGPPPSKMDQRQEALMVEGKTRGGEYITLIQKFEREFDGSIKWLGDVFERPQDSKMRSKLMDGLYES